MVDITEMYGADRRLAQVKLNESLMFEIELAKKLWNGGVFCDLRITFGEVMENLVSKKVLDKRGNPLYKEIIDEYRCWKKSGQWGRSVFFNPTVTTLSYLSDGLAL
ncbi:hypothetical protein J6590_106949 [Homalodisca vitripennis]|nr:hypothetical protein J6590_106949 [Homalodisca vitripennis]